MAQYKISGIWKEGDPEVITAYAFHTLNENSNKHTRATKTTKARAIQLLETAGNTAYTWIWNYKTCYWELGEKVTVVNGSSGKYLRSSADNKLTDNLAHLIDYDWISK